MTLKSCTYISAKNCLGRHLICPALKRALSPHEGLVQPPNVEGLDPGGCPGRGDEQWLPSLCLSYIHPPAKDFLVRGTWYVIYLPEVYAGYMVESTAVRTCMINISSVWDSYSAQRGTSKYCTPTSINADQVCVDVPVKHVPGIVFSPRIGAVRRRRHEKSDVSSRSSRTTHTRIV